MDNDMDEWAGLRYPCSCYEYDLLEKASGCKHEDIQPILLPRNGRDGVSYTVARGAYKICLVDQRIPRYWFRELAGDLQTVVWMDGERVINITLCEKWKPTSDVTVTIWVCHSSYMSYLLVRYKF